MQDHDTRPPAIGRRALLGGLGALTATAATTGCSGGTPNPPATGTTLGSADDVPVGAGRVYPEQKVVVTQPVQGSFHAFSAVCTHQGCTVEEIAGTTINCPCHGSRFDVTDGSVVRGPAQRPLTRLDVTVEAGSLRLR